jgi:rare lipoprotein A
MSGMDRISFRILFTAIFLIISVSTLPAEVYENGIASWYAGEFQGELTANGEIFDTHEISAAHKSLPFGTIVKVTNEENNLSVEVRINDRGPFVEGRIIDLSKAAAEKIEMVERGIVPVTLEIIYLPEKPESAYSRIEDAEYLTFQIGAFSSVRRALDIYLELIERDIQPSATITENRLIRIQVTPVSSKDREALESRLQEAGFTDLYITSVNP